MRRPKGPAKWGELWITRIFGGVRWVMRRDPWRGLSPPVATPLCAYCGCDECNEAIERIEAMKKPDARKPESVDPNVRVEVPKLMSKFPHTADLLLHPFWDDGSSKEGTCLFIFPGPLTVKLLVKVGCPPLKLMVQGRNWDEAFAALEVLLKGDDVPWEQDQANTNGGKKKKR